MYQFIYGSFFWVPMLSWNHLFIPKWKWGSCGHQRSSWPSHSRSPPASSSATAGLPPPTSGRHATASQYSQFSRPTGPTGLTATAFPIRITSHTRETFGSLGEVYLELFHFILQGHFLTYVSPEGRPQFTRRGRSPWSKNGSFPV